MRALKMAFLMVAATLMTGCFQIDVVHRLQPYGVSDTGAYRISMNNFTYGMIQGDGSYAKLVGQLRRFSRPTLRVDDNGAHLEDLSSVASMEHMYNTYNCQDAPVADYVDCRFVTSIDFKETPGFVVDWAVALPANAQVLSSNHQRVRNNVSDRWLMWHFDSTSDRGASIDLSVRVPRARR